MVIGKRTCHYVGYTDYCSKLNIDENERELVLDVNVFWIGNKLTASVAEACNEYCEAVVSTYSIAVCLPILWPIANIFVRSIVCAALVVYVCWC